MLTQSYQKDEDISLDTTLRPQGFKEYQGQDKIKENLKILIN